MPTVVRSWPLLRNTTELMTTRSDFSNRSLVRRFGSVLRGVQRTGHQPRRRIPEGVVARTHRPSNRNWSRWTVPAKRHSGHSDLEHRLGQAQFSCAQERSDR
ncbi:hypothetical protein ACWGH4_12210 [Streptomyces sp. NPDC054847]